MKYLIIILVFLILLFDWLMLNAQTIDMALGYQRTFNNDFIGYNGQSMERDSIGWSNPFLLSNLPKLNPKNIRYPGGGVSNWWDWRKGWFVNDPGLPPAYSGIPVRDNRLENFKKSIDATGSNAILVLNMITSTLSDQVAMLKHADSIGIKVKLVELGSEFYLEGGDDSVAIVNLFPTAESYAIVASKWADTIHKYFPLAKVAAQGAYNRNNAPRRITWDENLYPSLHGENVISFHTYMSAAKADEEYNNTIGAFTSAELPTLFSRPFKMWDILSTEDLPLVPKGDDVWITEYNLRDKNKPTQGCWAHGLFAATQTMLFLNDSRIKHLAFHSMDGTAVAGSFFNVIDGYNYGSAGHFIPPTNPPASTQYWGLTAAGRTMQQLGLAMKNMTNASPLEFYALPTITTIDGEDTITYPAIYGWAFTSNDSTQVCIVNLSATEYKITTSSIFPASGKFERYYGDALMYVAYESDLSQKGPAVLPTGSLALKAYSITRIKAGTVPAPPPTISMVANGTTTFCSGDSVQLDAGANYLEYLWSTGATTKNIWAKKNESYWVRVRNVHNGYWTADTTVVTVNSLPSKPTIKVPLIVTFCEGEIFNMEVKAPDSELTYSWSNGLTGTTSQTTIGGAFTVTATNSVGCSKKSDPLSVTEFTSPKPVVTPGGPLENCYDNVSALNAGGGYKSYTWNDGKVGQKYTPSVSGTYSCTVVDFNVCSGKSNSVSLTIHEPALPVVTINGPTAFCDGTSPTYLKAPAGFSYQWLKGSTSLEGETNSKYYPTKGGTYKVKIIDTWSCTKKSSGTSITVNKNPTTKITILNGDDKKICVGIETVTLQAKAGSGYTYKWKLDAITIPLAIDQNYIALAAGDFTYKVTDANGCTATSAITTITNNCKIINDDGGTKEVRLLEIYPNPASSSVNIHSHINGDVQEAFITVRNIVGQSLIEAKEKIESGELNADYDVSQLPAGIYFVVMKQADQTIVKKLIIE
ncbi:MAG: T9SS type A sorting domain-containing protein [Chitinophagales bacterium]|nr:T9SS type A sorting domain-containing protein [Chitinophagales bacterium]